MKNNKTIGNLLSNNIARLAFGTAFILLVPLVAMQFSDEVVWTLSDFVIMGTLLFGTGLVLTQAMKKARSDSRRALIGAAIILAFLYIWAELAVGIFTNLGS